MKKLNKKLLIVLIILILNILAVSTIFAATTVKIDKEKKKVIITVKNADGSTSTTSTSLEGNAVGIEDIDADWEDPTENGGDYAIVNNGCTFGGGLFTFEMLCEHGDYLCSQRGGALTGGGNPTYDSMKDSKGETSNKNEVPEAPGRSQAQYTVGDRVNATPEQAFILAFAQHSTGGSEYTPAQLAWWNCSGGNHKLTDAAKKKLTADLIRNSYGSDLEQVLGQGEDDLNDTIKKTFDNLKGYNNLNDMAKNFQTYILLAAEKEQTNDLTRDDEGFFELNYEPKWVESSIALKNTKTGETLGVFDCANPTVSLIQPAENGVGYIVGPFAIDYIDVKNFSFITNMKVETDDPEHKELEYETDWVLANVNEDNNSFPKSKEPFYIVIKNKYNATEVTNIHVDFSYLNAKGSYSYFDGKIKEGTLTVKKVEEKVPMTNAITGEEYEVTVTKYEWEIKIGELPAQRIAGNLNVELKYFSAELNRETTSNYEGQIKIKKVIVDEEDKELNIDSDEFFEFDLKVNGSTTGTGEKIRVKAGETASSKVYAWNEEDPVPTYTLQELASGQDGYEIMKPKTGSLQDKGTLEIKAVNKIKEPKTASLSIIKKVKESELGENTKPTIDGDDTFKFKITVSGKFKYNNGEYKKQVVEIIADVPADGQSKKVIEEGVIKWYEDEAPKYIVEEIDLPEGVKTYSITPSSGSFLDKQETVITAVNEQETKKGKIEIIKTLENADRFSEEELKKLEFHFEIQVEGYEKEYGTATPEKSGDTYIWRYESRDYEWYAGEDDSNPKYTIKEVDNPEGTAFDATKTSEANSGNQAITVTEDSVSGTLQEGENGTVGVVENHITNKSQPNTGKIELIKKIDNIDKLNEVNNFKFIIKVSGTFEYKPEGATEGIKFTNQTIQLTTSGDEGYVILNDPETYDNERYVEITVAPPNTGSENTGAENTSTENTGTENTTEAVAAASGTWTSGEFSWYGETAPTYTVEEDLTGEDINHSINPSEGKLSDSDVIKVTAWNYHEEEDKVGYIHIIKTLENSDKMSIEAIKKLEFKFKIKVDGYEEYTVTLKPELKDQTWVWEYTSNAFAWEADPEKDNAPTYVIEEVDIPDGVKFGSVSGENATIEGAKITGKLKENDTASATIDTTDVEYINKQDRVEQNKGKLKIKKEVTINSLESLKEDRVFKFKVTLKGEKFFYNNEEHSGEYIFDVTLTGAGEWISEDIKWYGDENDGPTYTVVEEENDFSVVTSMENNTGKIRVGEPNLTNVVVFVNGGKPEGGYLTITKNIQGEASSDDIFYFEIKIGEDKPYTISLKANETYKSNYIKWYKSDGAPKYTVKEVSIPENSKLIDIINAEGTLSENSEVKVVAENEMDEKSGNFKVTKTVLPNKYIDSAVSQSFKVKISISGNFEMNGKKHYETDPAFEYTETLSVSAGNSTNSTTYVSPDIKWWGDNAPTVTVEEIDIPKGWRQVGTPSNNGASLVEDDTIEIVVTNELLVHLELKLTIELAGQVWEDVAQDTGKNMLESNPNGKIDSTESGVESVEVYIYRIATNGNNEISRTLAPGYDGSLNAELEYPILTKDDGSWEAPRMEMSLSEEEKAQGATAVRFDVEFVYDGQTYEPTIFLSKVEDNTYVEGSASDYINSRNRNSYADRSMAKDYDREIVNNRIQEIYGNLPINGNGETSGKVKGATGEYDVFYEANITEKDATRAQSKLITLNDDGTALDVFKAKARTSVGGLIYPFDNRMHLESYDIKINKLGELVQSYTYSATYDYCLHINLGLVRREEADVDAVKDLVSAKVLVDGKELNYTFNKLADLGKDSLTRHSEIDGRNISYELGLYKTDYYYRAEIYRTDADVYDAITEIYKEVGGVDTSELEVYLTYKISLYNSSKTYLAQINSVDDYFDSTFGSPIAEKVERIVDNNKKEVANASYITTPSGTNTVTWNVTEKDITGSDGITYNKMTANLDGVRLASGEKAEIYVTFALQKTTVDGVKNAIELGTKSNIVEISNYSTYNADGSIAGKIDRDSAPANVNIENYNDKKWYEDDTDSAPVLTITLEEENREITGVAWEDKATGDTANGDGIRNNEEALIGGLTTELIEKIEYNNVEYDFLWPTNKPLDSLGGNTLEDLTGGFSSTIETLRYSEDDVPVGGYKFTSVPTGNYVVRFLYGNDKTELEDTSNVTLKPAEALNSDGTKYYSSDLIYTANYDGDIVEKLELEDNNTEILVSTPAVYNGQDYKSTIYQAGIGNTDGSGYVSNAWHDLTSIDIANTLLSDARDSEARRLEVIANSQTITNVNGTVLETANDKDAIHTELYQDYYMFADTAKLDLDIAAYKDKDGNQLYGIDTEVEGKTLEKGKTVEIEKVVTAYTIKDIDFGLIERPENVLLLDKEISSIKITTNDQTQIFNAVYTIKYDSVPESDKDKSDVVLAKIDSNNYLVANISLDQENSTGVDQLQAMNKTENKLTDSPNTGVKNFRFINVDESILQGTTIEINYQISALNISEVDYASEALANVTATEEKTVKQQIKDFANEIKDTAANTEQAVQIGKYLGTSYYTGNVGNDVVVTTKVRQIIDYVDNDAVFTPEYNSESNHMWRNTSITELAGSGIEANRILDKNVLPGYQLIDKNGISYITEQRNNVILSVDDDTEISDANSTVTSTNAGFEKELVPYVTYEGGDNNDSNVPYKSEILLTITKTVSAQDDADNLAYDNITEVVKFENTVGRRDIGALVGNANPNSDEFETAIKERDSSATELVTFTPPTGIETEGTMITQISIVVIIALGIVVVGIIGIKKFVLKK